MKRIIIVDTRDKKVNLSSVIQIMASLAIARGCTVTELDAGGVQILADVFQSACDQQEDLIGYTETLTEASEINSIRSEYRRLERLLTGGPDV